MSPGTWSALPVVSDAVRNKPPCLNTWVIFIFIKHFPAHAYFWLLFKNISTSLERQRAGRHTLRMAQAAFREAEGLPRRPLAPWVRPLLTRPQRGSSRAEAGSSPPEGRGHRSLAAASQGPPDHPGPTHRAPGTKEFYNAGGTGASASQPSARAQTPPPAPQAQRHREPGLPAVSQPSGHSPEQGLQARPPLAAWDVVQRNFHSSLTSNFLRGGEAEKNNSFLTADRSADS